MQTDAQQALDKALAASREPEQMAQLWQIEFRLIERAGTMELLLRAQARRRPPELCTIGSGIASPEGVRRNGLDD